jgi:thioester reductase-like protein
VRRLGAAAVPCFESIAGIPVKVWEIEMDQTTNSSTMNCDVMDECPIAIVGLSGRYPGAANPAALWRNLKSGVDGIREPDGWRSYSDYYHPDQQRPGKTYLRVGGFLNDIDLFDADFFGFSPREAGRMDPQQRLVLELTWQALEDAGIAPQKLSGSNCGVFIGVSAIDYLFLQFQDPASITAYSVSGGALSIVANRVSYFYDLHGPSMAIDTACSSSLVAIHQACRSIWSGEAPLALAGGVNLLVAAASSIGPGKASMLSRSGRCRSFDAAADGYVRSEGGGVVVLKALAAAERDGDRIHGVIVASGTNADGHTTGLSLPNRAAQEQLLRAVYGRSGIAPDSVAYVEAHGTGTPVGDPIECSAIGRVMGAPRRDGEVCLIGSIKSNIGHCESAAGIAGLTKALLALRHRELPSNLHFKTPNPKIAFDELKLRVVSKPTPLPDRTEPIIFGVNSFGFGGSNAHLVIREYRAHKGRQSVGSAQRKADQTKLLILSAHSGEALKEMAGSYAEWLKVTSDAELSDICASVALRRSQFAYRLVASGATTTELAERLRLFAAGEAAPRLATARTAGTAARLVFVFTGNGPQWWGMGRGLMATDEVYRNAVREVDALFESFAGWSLCAEMALPEQASRMALTEIAQPCLFALQVGLAAMLRAAGIKPVAVVGHSVGEIAASYVAGALTLEQAVKVIYARSSSQAPAAGQGTMAAVGLGPAEATDLIARDGGWLEIAAINSPHSVTLSGDLTALERVGQALTNMNVFFRMLALNYPFHSRAMDQIERPVATMLRDLLPAPGEVPFISTVEGRAIDGTALDARYWWRNIREPVQFSAAILHLLSDGMTSFLELGPHPVLREYMMQCARVKEIEPTILPTLHHSGAQKAELDNIWTAICACHAHSAVDPDELFDQPTHHVDLPPYPWQRQRHWHDARIPLGFFGPREHPLLGRRVPATGALWEGLLDHALSSYLAEHKIDGAVVFPASGFIEIALAGASLLHPDAACDLEDIDIRKALVLTDDTAAITQLSIDDNDGGFRVSSRASADTVTPMLHVTGRIAVVSGRTMPSPRSLEAIRARLTERIGKSDHYEAAKLRGLDYGPTFQGVQGLLVGRGEVLGELQAPGAITAELGEYCIHPCLLDSCFQLLLGLADDSKNSQDRAAYLPAFMRRFRLYRPLTDPTFCHARITNRKPRSITADLCILDDRGAVIAEMDGFRLQRVDFSRKAAPPLFSYGWKLIRSDPAVALARSLPSSIAIAQSLEPSLPQLMKLCDRAAFYDWMQPRIDRLAGLYAARALEQLAAGKTPFTTAALLERGGVKAEHARALECLLKIAADEEFIKSTTDGWLVAHDGLMPDPVSLWQQLMADAPILLPELTLMGRCGERLASLLRGDTNALELIFPEKGSGTAEHLYDSSISMDFYQRLIQAALAELVRSWPDERPMRILEVGAGTGGLTSRLIAVLPPERADYLFTDISGAFLGRAKQRFGSYGFVRYATLDIEGEPQAQGLAVESFDVIVASNVLHATRDLRKALGHVHALLAPGGHLLLVELHEQPFLYICFAFLRSWWSFTDTDLRRRSPLLAASAWQSLLRDAGFIDPVALSDAAAVQKDRGHGTQHSVLLAHRAPSALPTAPPSESRAAVARTFLIVMDTSGPGASFGKSVASRLAAGGHLVFAASLGKPFEALGDGCFTLDPNRPQDFTALFAAIAENGATCDEIVHVAGISPLSDPTPDQLVAQQDLRCTATLHIVQAAKRVTFRANPRLWLISANAYRTSEEAQVTDPGQAPLWGIGRVLMNEHPEFKCRLIDLSVRLDDPIAPTLLTSELHASDDEDEVLLAPGRRYVNRLERPTLTDLSLQAGKAPAVVATTEPGRLLQLDFASPGNVDRVFWRRAPRREPGPGEVEICVHASGLNFRDVMCVMGMLPLQAIEESPFGDTLGYEYAGEIIRVGAGVTDCTPGDRVMGMRPPSAACLATHVIAAANTVVPIPAGVALAAAAAIPVVFITTYFGLHHQARLSRGESILIHGAAGGVGLAAIQIAKLVGAKIFGTAGTEEKRDLLRMLGVDHVLDSRSLSFADDIMQITGGQGIDVVLNSHAGEAIYQNLRILKPFGRFVEIGKRDIYANTKVGLRALRKNVSFIVIEAELLVSLRSDLCRQVLLEVVALMEQGKLRPLPYRVFPMTQVEDAFRSMLQSRHVGKLVVTMEGRPQSRAEFEDGLPIQPDATYLVTGGLGGFGLATAKILAAKGARHFALVSRRGAASEEAPAGIAAMEASGASVRAFAVDIADEAAVARMIDDIKSSMPPIRGVIHAALVMDDGIVLKLDRARLHSVLAPKMIGALNLHHLTLDQPLDFFVLYGSAMSIFGNPGQAAYGAANLYLEGLATYRRARGLPALTVGWMQIAQAGYVARNPEVQARLRRTGLKGEGMKPTQAVAELGRFLAAGADRVWTLEVDLNALPTWPILSSPKIQRVNDGSDAEGSSLQSNFNSVLGSLPAGERLEFVAKRVREHVARVLATNSAQLDLERPLSDIGLDSLMSVELGTQIERDMGVDVPLMEVIQSGTINSLAGRILKAKRDLGVDENGKSAVAAGTAPHADQKHEIAFVKDRNGKSAGGTRSMPRAIDLPAEAVLPLEIDAKSIPAARTDAPDSILLTGATGFLGAYLLAELLRRTCARIHCPVRARSMDDGRRRLHEQLIGRFPEASEHLSRIVPLPSDLGRPGLGLDAGQLQLLANDIDVIYHNGAIVNFLDAYDNLKPVNVLATEAILRLACTARLKPVHFVSSFSVFFSNDYLKWASFPERTSLEYWEGLPNGYIQSKWVSDQLVAHAISRGIPACIYRPGFITGDRQTGKGRLDDMPPRLIKACIQLGVVPRLSGASLDMTPVDFVAPAIAHLSQRSDSTGKAFHLVNPSPIPFSRLTERLRAFGYRIGEITYQQWLDRLRGSDDTNAMHSLRRVVESPSNELIARLPPFESHNTIAGLSDTSLTCPTVDDLLDTYFAYYFKSGFLSPPLVPAQDIEQRPLITLGKDQIRAVDSNFAAETRIVSTDKF